VNVVHGASVTLCPWRRGDRAPLAAMRDDPEVMRHPGSGRFGREKGDALATCPREHVDAEGFGLRALDVPGQGFAGFVGLGLRLPFELALPGILPRPHDTGWRLARSTCGQGCPTEAAMTALRHGLDVLGPPRIVSFGVPQNRTSLAVMRCIGWRRRGECAHPRFPVGHRLRRHVPHAADAPRIDSATRH